MDVDNYTLGMPTGIRLWSQLKPKNINVMEHLKDETLTIFHEAKRKCPDLKVIE
jgi:hypothetical protein